MKLIRLRAGEWLAAIAAVAIPVTLALPWYGARAREAAVTGFESLTVIDVLLLAIAAVGLTLAVLQATRDSPGLPVAFCVLTVTTGLIGILLVLFRLVDEPGPDEFLDVRLGAWACLAATVGLTAGGWLALANEHVRGLPPGPEPELRPAPRIADRAQP
jgi:hypothetical protein